MMKSIKLILFALLLAGPMAAAVAASSAHRNFSAGVHSGFHGGHGGGFRGPHVGVFIDPWPLFYPYGVYGYGYWPYEYAPYAGYPPVVVTQPAAPTVYVEQGQGATPTQNYSQQSDPSVGASNSWYYCHNPEGYYPYVRDCAAGWQRVPAQPPTQR